VGKNRRGMTLLELLLATTLMTTMVVTVAVTLRTGHSAWEAHQNDAEKTITAAATVRHVVRRVRQAEEITRLDPDATELELLMPSGNTMAWRFRNNNVLFGVNTITPEDILSTEITDMKLTGYASDGTTETAVAADVHSVKCEITVTLPRGSNSRRTVSSRAWLRSW